MKNIAGLIIVVACLLCACKIDETYVQNSTVTLSRTQSRIGMPTAHIVTADPHRYPTVPAGELHAVGEFVPVISSAVWEDISMQHSTRELVPGDVYPFVAYTNIDGIITFLCVDWETLEDGVSFRWDCTGWVLATNGDEMYGETIYYYNHQPNMAPTRIPTPTMEATEE